jgi:hypothetical protein
MSNFHDSFGRIHGLALVDIIGTILIGMFFIWYYALGLTESVLLILFLFVLGELVHVLTSTSTPITRKFRQQENFTNKPFF